MVVERPDVLEQLIDHSILNEIAVRTPFSAENGADGGDDTMGRTSNGGAPVRASYDAE
jgi:hypothetical protein